MYTRAGGPCSCCEQRVSAGSPCTVRTAAAGWLVTLRHGRGGSCWSMNRSIKLVGICARASKGCGQWILGLWMRRSKLRSQVTARLAARIRSIAVHCGMFIWLLQQPLMLPCGATLLHSVYAIMSATASILRTVRPTHCLVVSGKSSRSPPRRRSTL
jgi:hypothetical protein